MDRPCGSSSNPDISVPEAALASCSIYSPYSNDTSQSRISAPSSVTSPPYPQSSVSDPLEQHPVSPTRALLPLPRRPSTEPSIKNEAQDASDKPPPSLEDRLMALSVSPFMNPLGETDEAQAQVTRLQGELQVVQQRKRPRISETLDISNDTDNKADNTKKEEVL